MPFKYEGRTALELINNLAFTNMNQFNHFRNTTNKTLDLIFSNVDNITICKPFSLLTKEDNYHPAFIAKIKHENIKFMEFSKPNRLNFLEPIMS